MFARKHDNTSYSISDTGYRQCTNEFADFACISLTDDRMYEIHRISISYISIEELQYIDASDTKWWKSNVVRCIATTKRACEQPTRVFYPRCYLNQVINARYTIRKIILHDNLSITLTLFTRLLSACWIFLCDKDEFSYFEGAHRQCLTHNNYLVLHFTY